MTNKTNTKSGVRTTEFWLAAAVAIGGMLSSQYAEAEWAQVAGTISAALATAGYGFARSQVKRSEVVVAAGAAERADVMAMQKAAARGPTGLVARS